MMTCLICRQAEIIDGLTSITFVRGEFRLVMNGVPAHLCRSCGEAYVDEEVAVRLLRDADELLRSGMLDVVHRYNIATNEEIASELKQLDVQE
jgi:YgiT-type zinc finger domain-containing protein